MSRLSEPDVPKQHDTETLRWSAAPTAMQLSGHMLTKPVECKSEQHIECRPAQQRSSFTAKAMHNNA